MKLHVKLLSFATALMSLMTACINEGIQEPQDAANLKLIPTLEQQAAAVEESVKDLQNLQTEFEADGVEFGLNAVETLEHHVAYLKNGGLSLEEGTLATFELQKKLGAIVGSALAELDADKYESKLKRSVNALENSVKVWAGESFNVLYQAAVAEARVKASVADFDSKLGKQKLYVDALLSDVEAGFRKDEKPEELKGLAASVQESLASSKKLNEDFAGLAAEVVKEYTEAVAEVVSDPAGFDGAALKQFNANAGLELAEVDNSLAGLSTRVAACQSQLEDIRTRLGALEEEIGNLEELLGMIQSVTLMSEYSAEEAVAYYNMSDNELDVTQEGYRLRTPAESVELNYIVRPASAAVALETASLWNNGLKVFGYYANRIEQSAVNFEDFTITAVEADELTGVVSITVANSLSEEFFYKKTGAKMALSISTGKTDITSKFVEVVPKDASGTVYLESLTLPVDYVEIDDGQSYQLNAKITPANVTDAEVTWTSTDVKTVEVSGTGKLDAKAVGNVVITVTSNSTDEWGRQLSAKCNVKVTPNIKLNAPSYIEEGGTMEIKVESPEYIDPSLITWDVSKWENGNQYVATIDENGVVTATHHTYNTANKAYDPIYVTCSIYGGQTVINHELRVVVPQPKKIVIPGKGDNENSHTVKIGSEYSLASTIYPDAVQTSGYFGIIYQSSYDAVASIDFNSGLVKTHAPGTANMTITAKSVNTGRYAYPSGTEWKRYFDIIVEPYWVETLTLPETMTLAPNATATLTPVFTSDVNGKQPTNQTLTWTSSDPSIVSINETTGEMQALAEGSVQITATTASGAAANSAIKTATCIITVKAPVAEVKIGDYYYSDGTWGSNRYPSGKSVIGVIISNANAVAADPLLLRDYPNCSNGLAVALPEYTDQDFGSVSNQNGHGYYAGLGYDANSIVSTEKTNGYGNTLAHRDLNASKSDYCKFFNASNGVVATHTAKVSTPSKSSAWYIPSYKEMRLMYDNLSTLNASLSNIGGTPISSEKYWTSTIWGKWYAAGQTYDHVKYPFNMSTGGWHSAQDSSGKLPVRVVLAF